MLKNYLRPFAQTALAAACMAPTSSLGQETASLNDRLACIEAQLEEQRKIALQPFEMFKKNLPSLEVLNSDGNEFRPIPGATIEIDNKYAGAQAIVGYRISINLKILVTKLFMNEEEIPEFRSGFEGSARYPYDSSGTNSSGFVNLVAPQDGGKIRISLGYLTWDTTQHAQNLETGGWQTLNLYAAVPKQPAWPSICGPQK